MRLFFAVDLAPRDKLSLAAWRDEAFRGLVSARAVPPDNFHVTLAFRGEIPEAALERLFDAVDQWVARPGLSTGSMVLDQVGYWPKPGILWLGPEAIPPGLVQMAKGLQGVGTQFGARREKRAFQPHVTLFRRCEQAPPALHAPDIRIEYNSFTLFESRQRKGGVSYYPLQEWRV